MGTALALILSACAGVPGKPRPGTGSTAPTPPAISPVPTETRERLLLYFPHQTRPVLVAEERLVLRRGQQPEWLALTELLAGPRLTEARTVLRSELQSQFAGPKVFDGDTDLFIGRQGAEALREAGLLSVYAVINTLAAGRRVKRVRFIVDRDGGPWVIEGVDITRHLTPRWDLVGPAAPGGS